MNINKLFQSAVDYYQTGNLEQAESLCRQVVRKQRKHVDALNLLGILSYCRADYDSAIKYIKRALKLNPDNAEAYTNMGNAYKNKGQLDKAITSYEEAIKLKPHLAMAHNNLGSALQEQNLLDEAVTCYQKALKLEPDLYMAYNNLGVIMLEKGHLDEAAKYCRKAIALNPGFADAYNNLGYVYKDKGQIDEAEAWFRRAIHIRKDFSTAYCNLLLTMEYNSRHDPHFIYAEHLNFSKRYAQHFASTISTHKDDHDPSRKLKIGYVSPDFKRHPVTFFFEPVIRVHNREHFEIFCYSNSSRHDEVTKRIRQNADRWRNIERISDQAVAELIQKDGIDILVDLAGHTAGNRIFVFARKPSPIQTSWIGYLSTTGLSTMDYKIADNYTDPPGQTEQFYTEKLVRLPESFLCCLPAADSPDVGPLPALSRGHITFGSFNNFAKITPEVFTLWAKVLHELPNSHLILKGKSFHDKATCGYAINMFTQRGIAEERIALQSWDPPPKHLESYNQVDIGLDTFPFNGAATSCEAMWMGVPVVTLSGVAYHSRVGVSLLSNVGLSELVAKTPDEYVSLAVKLAGDLNKLKSLRGNLRDMMTCSPLCDAKTFTANLEMCYRRIWERWCESV
jgi:protein O-GlcNAc transferase